MRGSNCCFASQFKPKLSQKDFAPICIPATFFWVKCTSQILVLAWPGFPKTSWQFNEDRQPLNTSKVIWSFPDAFRMNCKDLKALWLFYRAKNHLGIFMWKLNWIFVVFVLKNNGSGFGSQGWEVDLSVWDRCLLSTGMRLTHNVCKLAGILIYKLRIMLCMPL